MVRMHLIPVCAALSVLRGAISAPTVQADLKFGDGGPVIDETAVLSNASALALRAGPLGKREIFNRCSNQYAGFVATAIQDAGDIVRQILIDFNTEPSLANGCRRSSGT
jgi:hypothetical protein